MNEITEFVKSAFKFTRNPLGIIGLFIVLLYGFAALVLGFSQYLDASQRWPLIWFLIIFPVIILASFLWLVIKHHTKLYGPNDFSDERWFAKLASPEELVKQKHEDYTKQESSQKVSQSETQTNKSMNRKMNSESPTSYKEFMKKSFLSEELVIKQIESEYGQSVKRGIKIIMGSNKKVFDGILTLKDRTIFIEVKYLRNISSISKNLIFITKLLVGKLASFFSYTNGEPNAKPSSLLLAIVTEGNIEKDLSLINPLIEEAKQSHISLEIRFFNIR
ncbi:MAG: hypothetical protein WC852_00980, partial [Candidatus Nanoarchaeia archaeon]